MRFFHRLWSYGVRIYEVIGAKLPHVEIERAVDWI